MIRLLRQQDVEAADTTRAADLQLGRLRIAILIREHLLGAVLDRDVRVLVNVLRRVDGGLKMLGGPRLERTQAL